MTPIPSEIPENRNGIDMNAVYHSLARVLVLLDESEYTENKSLTEMQQADVSHHTSLPDQASEETTRRAND